MTRELIIEGQHVDLAPDTDITLEYVNNLLGDIGKISLSHSYTVKLPKTTRNTRILDDPGSPGHESGVTRRFLNARYYRNGIDLIGKAQAYIMKTTPDKYELALVWNTLDSLQALSQYKGTLNDLPNLPVLTWIGPNGTTPDYTGGNDKDGALFAFYNSGLGSYTYPTVNTTTHPCVRISNLLTRIIQSAGVPYTISKAANKDIQDLVILAAPKHTPNPQMEQASGSVKKDGVYLYQLYSVTTGPLNFQNYDGTNYEWQDGWDYVYGGILALTGIDIFKHGGNDNHRIRLNLKGPEGFDLSGAKIIIRAVDYRDGLVNKTTADLFTAYFKEKDNFYYVDFNEPINVSGWPYYEIWLKRDSPIFPEDTTQHVLTFTPYDASRPIIAVNREHEAIQPDKDNRFPIQGNLPDIKQWDLIKACMAMFGWAAVIQNGKLNLLKYSEILDIANAYDWTSKLDMTDGAPQEFNYTLDSWAQINTLKFLEDSPLGFEPNASLEIEDVTLPEQRDFYEIPFAASMQSDAPHYKVDGAEVDDVDMEPRIFRIVDKDGVRTLEFTEDLYGKNLIATHYSRFQKVIQKPVKLTVNIRLHEIDLAQLDLTRAVYLRQYGKYYMILKIQTSDTDLCKVELLQLP